ncbi:MAG: galactose-1-phosphate uridylyltransferase [Bifidobacteriaceae bacterium]|nr:galactose-1-phosphate uridylyltransferase [Bifidobacteriaceae bacterium]
MADNVLASKCIDVCVDYAIKNLELCAQDADYVRNELLALLGFNEYEPTQAQWQGENIQDRVYELCDAGLVQEDELGVVFDRIMGCVTPVPSVLNKHFEQLEQQESSEKAMRWFYDLCVQNTYVKRAQLLANPRFDSHGLVITINTSKPEFKNMAKAATGNAVQGGYPQCTICHENEGFVGRLKSTLRTIPMRLGEQSWFWQFSPYGYFEQHGICVNSKHTPMVVNRNTFVHLIDFVKRFPNYFLGCNAALPRIGGSVLAHDHYQGGGEHMPMHHAKALHSFELVRAGNTVLIEVLDWPGTAIRIVSQSAENIIESSEAIRSAWASYNNAELNIISSLQGEQQSSVSPSLVVTERGYEMNIILRNNAVSEEYPDGIFHAHPQYYAVKQEPIGLIEAQGLFILPGRLVQQLAQLEELLLQGQTDLPKELEEFELVWNELKEKIAGLKIDREMVQSAIREELGSVCYRILENTAVFKNKNDVINFVESIEYFRKIKM